MSFESFWKQYPRKVAKRTALKSWQKLNPVEQQLASEAIIKHIEYWKLKDTGAEYIPHASTWLNQGRWEDELDMTVQEKKVTLPWWQSDEMTLAKAQEVGIVPRAGEPWGELRKRIVDKLSVKV